MSYYYYYQIENAKDDSLEALANSYSLVIALQDALAIQGIDTYIREMI